MEPDTPVAVHPLDEQPAASAFGPPPAWPPPTEHGAFGTELPAEPYLAPPSPSPLPSSPAPPSRPALKTWLAGGLAAAVFGIGGFFGIQAVTHHAHTTTIAGALGGNGFPGGPGGGGPGFPGGGRGTIGTITTISGSTLTVTANDGSTVTVTTSPSTTVTAEATGSLSDVKAGDHVVVRGTSGTGSLTADQITDTGSAAAAAGPGGGPGGPGGGSAVSGTVASVGSGTFTVTATGGATDTIKTSSSTTVTVIRPSALSALAVGNTVRVIGTTTNSSVAATSIQSGAVQGGGPGGFGGFGGGGGPAAA